MDDENDLPLPRSRAALLQLDQALRRLETAVEQKIDDVSLADELKAVRADYIRLDDTSHLVESRLDGVVTRLKTLLDEEPEGK